MMSEWFEAGCKSGFKILLCVSLLVGAVMEMALANYDPTQPNNGSSSGGLEQSIVQATQQANQVFEDVTFEAMGQSNGSFLSQDSENRPSYSLLKFPTSSSGDDDGSDGSDGGDS
jgi:hypothetical protein